MDEVEARGGSLLSLSPLTLLNLIWCLISVPPPSIPGAKKTCETLIIGCFFYFFGGQPQHSILYFIMLIDDSVMLAAATRLHYSSSTNIYSISDQQIAVKINLSRLSTLTLQLWYFNIEIRILFLSTLQLWFFNFEIRIRM